LIKALIFDFDGLIMDTESPEVEGWRAIYANYGQEFPLQLWVNQVVGASLANFDPAAYLADLLGQELDLHALHAQARQQRLNKQAAISAMPGVTAYLEEAHRLGLRLAVASSSDRSWVEGYLHQLGLFRHFEVIVCREDVSRIKPAPDLFLAALAALHLRPDEALAFEDSPNGVLAARAAGLRVVAVPNSVTAGAPIQGASLVLASLTELPLPGLLEQIDFDIRPEASDDLASIRQVEQQAFGRFAEADLVDLCRRHGRVTLSLVAVQAGQVVGHILFTPVVLEPPGPDRGGLGIGPLAVLPEWQRKGIGTRLMQTGLELARQQGYDFIVLLGDPHYYSRFGFLPGKGFGLSSEYGDGDEFQALELHPGAVTGVSRLVRYAPEFAEAGC
jgi:HAD superfamily hydrolase (TIGR01509 family)